MTAKPDFTHRFIDLAQPRLGAEVIEATDDFFAPKERLISPGHRSSFPTGSMTTASGWMDGKAAASAWLATTIASSGCAPEPSTAWTSTPATSPATTRRRLRLMCAAVTATRTKTRNGTKLIPKTDLQGDSHHYLPVQDRGIWTHARLNIYPDGGVARLRVYGVAHCDWSVRTFR